jgi:Zn-dependent peptidase ImmA (M78 family)
MKLNIFGQEVLVIFKQDFSKQTGWAGLYCHDTKTITVDKELKGEELAQTLLHEFFHAVFFRVGLMQAKVSKDAHEMIVENFATSFIENYKSFKKYLK